MAVFEATRETITPRLLAMLAILAVFVPSFFLVGVSKSLFAPLSLAVGFAMLASYFLSNTLVPVLSVWLLRHQHIHDDESFFNRAQRRCGDLLGRVMRLRWAVFGVYLLMAGSVIFLIGRHLGNDIFPNVDTGMFQLRLRAPAGLASSGLKSSPKKLST